MSTKHILPIGLKIRQYHGNSGHKPYLLSPKTYHVTQNIDFLWQSSLKFLVYDTNINLPTPYMISGFRREVGKNCALLGYCAASSGNSLPTFRDNLSFSLLGFLTLETETDMLSRNIAAKQPSRAQLSSACT